MGPNNKKNSPPRIFCIPATATNVVAVLRRGPSGWFNLGKWDVGQASYEAGSWLKGRVFPQRCDVSPDGRWFCYFAFSGGAQWDLGDAYCAVSRLPWLTALAAWGQGSTWTRGYHFTKDKTIWRVNTPDVGDSEPCRSKLGMDITPPMQFAVERRRGWVETQDCPPRDPKDRWDQNREVRLEKQQPVEQNPLRLTVEGKYAGFREMEQKFWGASDLMYVLRSGKDAWVLEDVQWADWSQAGQLLVSTQGGEIQTWEIKAMGNIEVSFAKDLSTLSPAPKPPPAWAKEW